MNEFQPTWRGGRIAVLAIAALMSGCASGPPFAGPARPLPGKALVYVYRPAHLVQIVNTYTVAPASGAPIAQLRGSSWQVAELAPGSLRLTAHDTAGAFKYARRCKPVDLQLGDGDVVYVELGVSMTGTARPGEVFHRCALQLAQPEVAQAAMKDMPRAE